MRANRRNQEPGVATPRLLDYTEERDMREVIRYADPRSARRLRAGGVGTNLCRPCRTNVSRLKRWGRHYFDRN